MSSSLPISLIRQHLFCPRIPYFQELLQLDPPRPIWVQQGETYHDRQQRKFRDRTLARFGLIDAEHHFNVSVKSESLALHGVIDSLLVTAEACFPVEFKLAGKKPTLGHIFQLTAYGMLAEQTFNKTCRLGFIQYEEQRKCHAIEITEERKQRLLELRQEIQKNLDEGRLPDSSANAAQCGQCEFLSQCNDRE